MQCSNIKIIPQALVLKLWLRGDRCQEICLLCQNQITWLKSSVVILATGGGGQVYAHTTNPKVSTGDNLYQTGNFIA